MSKNVSLLLRVSVLFLVTCGSSRAIGPDRYADVRGGTEVAVDSPAPELDVTEWHNTKSTPSMESLRGKVVLLDFWGVWCSPCVKAVPRLSRIDREFRERGLVVIAIHTPNKADLIPEFLREHDASFIIGVDTGETARRYGVSNYPAYVLVLRDGTVDRILDTIPGDDEIARWLER